MTATTYKYLDELTYCLDAGYPAPLIEAMMALAGRRDTYSRESAALTQAHEVWDSEWCYSFDDFTAAVEEITGEECVICADCGTVAWTDCTTTVATGDHVCDDTCLDRYTSCDDCGEYFPSARVTRVSSTDYCTANCLDTNCTWCHDCDEFYLDCDSDEHCHDEDEQCDCEAPHRRFEFPNDGDGTVSQDERVTVELAKGTIDDEGIRRITELIRDAIRATRQSNDDWWILPPKIITEVGPLWQTKRGNFTRRLSAALFKQGHKLPEGVISEVGNLARAHSSETACWLVEFTRALNGSAEEFCNEDSCWWGSEGYSQSRCALKNWGGLGLRTYARDSQSSYNPSGRAWVQPLDATMKPTHDTVGAHAYVVFNGYGDMEGYVAARIVAHLTSRTYRKVGLNVSSVYVNGDTGFLVADEATCLAHENVTYNYGVHDQLDAATLYKKAAAA